MMTGTSSSSRTSSLQMKKSGNTRYLPGGRQSWRCCKSPRPRQRHLGLLRRQQQQPWLYNINILVMILGFFLLSNTSIAIMVNISSLLLNKNNKNNSPTGTTNSKMTVDVTNLQLPPSSRFQKVEGYIHGNDSTGSGYIDISNLAFTIASSSSSSENDADNDADNEDNENDVNYFLDLALLYVPDRCHETPEGCDLAKDLGIGVPSQSSGKSNSWYCCTHDARLDGACNITTGDTTTSTTDFGRLILNKQLFHGEQRNIAISAHGPLETRHFVGAEAQFLARDGGGEYALILANCNTNSRLVIVNGTVTFVSTFSDSSSTSGDFHGDATAQPSQQQQGQVQEFAMFYPTLAILYLLLLLWFARLLIQHVTSRIALEKWIFVTIVMGFCEMTLRALEFIIWQYNTYRRYKHHDDEMTGQVVPTTTTEEINSSSSGISSSNSAASHPAWLALVAVIFGSCKHGVGRSLFLMLALGWGVVRAELRHCTMTIIVGMASTYILCDEAFDLVNYLVSYHDFQISSQLGNVLLIIFILQNIMEVTFTIWIPVALCRTMAFLKKTNQERKLERYRLLLYILACATSLTILTILYLVLGPPSGSPIVSLSLGNEVNFFLILLLVSIVWRPNPNARDYAYVMQLSTSGAPEDDEDDGIMLGDLDLSGKTAVATVAKSSGVIA